MHSVILVSVFEIIVNFTEVSNALSTYILSGLANPPLLSIIGARLLFNMKEAGEKGLNEGTSCGSKSTVSEIDFADAPQVTTEYSQDGTAQDEAIEMVEFV